MTKLSLLGDHDIKLPMAGSSSILSRRQQLDRTLQAQAIYLYSLCINAVCTTLGCCDEVAAAALIPFPAAPFCICVASP